MRKNNLNRNNMYWNIKNSSILYRKKVEKENKEWEEDKRRDDWYNDPRSQDDVIRPFDTGRLYPLIDNE